MRRQRLMRAEKELVRWLTEDRMEEEKKAQRQSHLRTVNHAR